MNSLRTRILLVIAGFGLFTALMLTAIMYSSVSSFYSNLQYDSAREFAMNLSKMHPDLPQRLAKDPKAVGDLLSQYVLLSPKTGLYLLDNEGRVMASAGEGKIFWSNYKVDLQKVKASLTKDDTVPIFADDPDAIGKSCIVAAQALTSPTGEMTWIYVVVRSADITLAPPELAKSYAVRVAIKVGLVTLAIGIALTLLVMAALTRPLTELTKAASEIQDGQEPLLPYRHRTDEIGKLSNTFQDLVIRLKQEVARVTQGDAQRREMIASVSHDVRTPLTALIAQLETIRLKKGELNSAEQQKLFDQALGNTNHLKKLTDSLAELGHLDSPEVKAAKESLPLGELADDVMQRFVPKAQAKQITLLLDYPENLPWVPVDANLLDRALSNLIDNALRYSPANTQVHLQVLPMTTAGTVDRIRLSVADQGPGVPEEERERIFQRFYQSTSHRAMRGSSGLGLAIVRRVAELHGGVAGVSAVNPVSDDALQPGANFWIDFPLNLAKN